MFVSDDSITVKPNNMGSGFQTSSHQLQGRSVQVLTGSPTLDHLLASLAAGGLAEDVVLEAVRLDGPQQDLGGARRGGEGRRRAGVGGAGRQRGVGAGRGGERRRPLVGQRALRERRRRRRGQRGRRIGRDDGRESEVVVVASLEEVVHALAAHHGFEGQGPLQALQLEDMEIRGAFIILIHRSLDSLVAVQTQPKCIPNATWIGEMEFIFRYYSLSFHGLHRF